MSTANKLFLKAQFSVQLYFIDMYKSYNKDTPIIQYCFQGYYSLADFSQQCTVIIKILIIIICVVLEAEDGYLGRGAAPSGYSN